jgi:maleylpyruvate isomerase
VHLNVEWRDLPGDAWHHKVRTIQGREVPATETVWMRTREVWMHAVDLANGASFADIPAPVLERLLKDITGAWHTRGTDKGLLVKVTGTDLTFGDPASASPVVVSGPLAAVVEWAAGRGAHGVTATGVAAPGGAAINEVPAAPKWI